MKYNFEYRKENLRLQHVAMQYVKNLGKSPVFRDFSWFLRKKDKNYQKNVKFITFTKCFSKI